MKQLQLPETGMHRDELLSKLGSRKKDDINWASGRMFSLIYNAGEEVREVAREASVWACFNNDWEGFAVRNALDLRAMLTRAGTPVGPRA